MKFIVKINLKCGKKFLKAGEEYPAEPTQELIDGGYIEAVADESAELPPGDEGTDIDPPAEGHGSDHVEIGDQSAGEPAPEASASPAPESAPAPEAAAPSPEQPAAPAPSPAPAPEQSQPARPLTKKERKKLEQAQRNNRG